MTSKDDGTTTPTDLTPSPSTEPAPTTDPTPAADTAADPAASAGGSDAGPSLVLELSEEGDGMDDQVPNPPADGTDPADAEPAHDAGEAPPEDGGTPPQDPEDVNPGFLQRMRQEQAAIVQQVKGVNETVQAIPKMVAEAIAQSMAQQAQRAGGGTGQTPASTPGPSTDPGTPGTPDPAPPADNAVQQRIDKIRESIEGMASYDGLDKDTAVEMLGLINDLANTGTQSAAPTGQVEALQAQLDQALSELGQVKQTVSSTEAQRRNEAKFTQMSEARGFDVRPLWKDATKEALQQFPGAATDVNENRAATALARVLFNSKIESHRPSPDPATPPAKPAAPGGPGTRPRQSAAGTTPQPPGAHATRAPAATREAPLVIEIDDPV